jgi:ketosteroid isomerase-like protein
LQDRSADKSAIDNLQSKMILLFASSVPSVAKVAIRQSAIVQVRSDAMKRVLFALFALSLFASAQTSPQPKAKAPAKLSGQQLLLRADRAFARDTAAKRLEGWMDYMAEDAVLFSDKPLVGKDAIRTFYQPAFARPAFILSWQPTRAEMFRSGNMGYTTGRYELQAEDGKGNKVVRHGSYLTVWKKQTDGSWKVMADGGDPDAH